MTQNERLRKLLDEARDWLYPDSEDDIYTEMELQSLRESIDAALAETANEWQPHEDPARTAYVVQIERERDEARAEVERLRTAKQKD